MAGSGRGGQGRDRSYRLRDWLFSRQRYWGEPFPIVYDEDGTAHLVPDDQLPINLPEVPDYSPKTFDPEDAQSNPEAPLSRNEDWVKVTLDLGDGPKTYYRDTNTMPNWAGSCWYYMRYLDPENTEHMVDILANTTIGSGRTTMDTPGIGRRGPLRRWRRARGAASALLALLAQGALRSGLRQTRPNPSTSSSTRA
jgi:hypothetical protein